MKNQAFTLIELLVVVLIIGILAAIALPQYQKAVLKARLMQYVEYATALKKANDIYFLANGVYSEDVREVDIDITGNATELKKGAWTSSETNVSAYYTEGTNCGVSINGGAGCWVDEHGITLWLYVGADGTMICDAYNALANSWCRSLSGGATGTAVNATVTSYEVKF